MTYTLHRLAEHDLERGFRYYKKNAGTRVALRFLAEFERVAELLDENPGFGTPTSEVRRTYPLRVYPYAVIYQPSDTGIRILVVRHHRLEPGFGRDRG